MPLEQGHGIFCHSQLKALLQGEAGRRNPDHRDMWDARAPVVLQDSLLLFILSNWTPVAADPAATAPTLWASVLPDGHGQMTWPPELAVGSGGYAESTDTRPAASRKLRKENTPGLLGKQRNTGRQTEVRGIRPTVEQRTGDGSEVRTQG